MTRSDTKRVLVTGSAGFVGFHLAQSLLQREVEVYGLDGMTDYYDVGLKQRRHAMLYQSENFAATERMLEDADGVMEVVERVKPDAIIHLAAQAGVRYSLTNPRAYVDSNLIGTFNILEAAREHAVDHLLMASTSSVYGANTQMPFQEADKTDTPLTFYAATKKANEAMAHSYAHLWKLPITMFRFFTVYGPWGRPDMALFKFVKATLEGKAIDLYNHGQMERDFTYVTDLVEGIARLIDVVPNGTPVSRADTLSPAAPFRVVNIGNGDKVPLMTFVEEIERALGRKTTHNMMEMQKGDVPATWADNGLLQDLTGYVPQTSVRDGVDQFVSWYRDYYRV
ncbi:MAG: NAD-dependent epimerase/dehydratase family protein [Pseudomonadota bacterium]